jgi:hypothetical protein
LLGALAGVNDFAVGLRFDCILGYFRNELREGCGTL